MQGFTLMEMLVVLGIIALLATLVAPQVLKYLGKAKSDTAAAQIRNLQSAIELYFLDTGQYPSSQDGLTGLVTAPDGLASWNGPYLKNREGLIDPWGKPYIYAVPGGNGDYELMSYGLDAEPGGEGENKDISVW
ncbi:MAG TPA: type II secretion system major pseudopilin GspG [Aestuariivirgaceae bacterium]|jgi:general secretion pathway protein G